MKTLKLIIAREFLAKVKNKTFIIMTFLSPLLMVGMIGLVGFLTKKSIETEKKIAYVDASQLFSSEDFKDSKGTKYVELTALGLETAKKEVEKNKYYGLLFIPKEDSIPTIAKKVEFFSVKAPNMIVVEQLEHKINRRLQNENRKKLGIDLTLLESSKISSDIKLTNFSGEHTSKMINGLKIGLGSASGYLIMMFIIIYGAMVMRSVIEEKTSRIIEVIISSVKPFQLMMGKILGTAMAGLFQFVIWGVLILLITVIASSVFGVSMMETQMDRMPAEQVEAMKNATSNGQHMLIEIFKLPLLKMFVLFIFYFLGGFLLYSSIYAAIGAAVDNETDTQQFMLPVIMPLMIAVYVGFASVIGDPHGTIATTFSMIPFTSPIVMLMRIPFGVSWVEIAISLTILVATFLAIVWLAAKIYRVGILMHGKKPSYKELYKWLKY